jgi:hypothetical protein
MADVKRWFKVWTAILDDPHHGDLSLEDVGRWTRLGAMTALAGRGGRLVVTPPAKRLLQVLEVDTVAVAKVVISRLPNVLIEEGKSDNGSFTVTWKNWTKYQADSTVYARVKRLRYKRREEKKREEEKRREESVALSPTLAPGQEPVEFKVNDEIKTALRQAPRLGAIPRLWSADFWRAQVRANIGVDFAPEILKAEAWMAANPHKAPRKDLARFLHNWLARADHGEPA